MKNLLLNFEKIYFIKTTTKLYNHYYTLKIYQSEMKNHLLLKKYYMNYQEFKCNIEVLLHISINDVISNKLNQYY